MPISIRRPPTGKMCFPTLQSPASAETTALSYAADLEPANYRRFVLSVTDLAPHGAPSWSFTGSLHWSASPGFQSAIVRMSERVQITDLSAWQAQPGCTRSYHAMVKPVGAICNIDCTYCYYLHKKELLGSENHFRISDEILEFHIKQYIEGQDREEVVFWWQGGEPTLLGLEFFQKVVELEQKYKKPYQRIENDLQTNGTLLNEEWGVFLKQHGFLVGLSIDGPRELHAVYRISKTASRPSSKCCSGRDVASPRRAI